MSVRDKQMPRVSARLRHDWDNGGMTCPGASDPAGWGSCSEGVYHCPDIGDNGSVADLVLTGLAYLPAPGPDRALWEGVLAELGAPVQAAELAKIIGDHEERGLI